MRGQLAIEQHLRRGGPPSLGHLRPGHIRDPGAHLSGVASKDLELGAILNKKEHKIPRTKLSTKVNIYLDAGAGITVDC